LAKAASLIESLKSKAHLIADARKRENLAHLQTDNGVARPDLKAKTKLAHPGGFRLRRKLCPSSAAVPIATILSDEGSGIGGGKPGPAKVIVPFIVKAFAMTIPVRVPEVILILVFGARRIPSNE
jgi:hypothetical protein